MRQKQRHTRGMEANQRGRRQQVSQRGALSEFDLRAPCPLACNDKGPSFHRLMTTLQHHQPKHTAQSGTLVLIILSGIWWGSASRVGALILECSCFCCDYTAVNLVFFLLWFDSFGLKGNLQNEFAFVNCVFSFVFFFFKCFIFLFLF